ncbi:MAG: zinc ribbon domain-containing protein, partial [Mycobacteriales bacterium]
MNSDPAAQLRLLDLQAVDTALAQQRYRREHLPELGEIATLTDQLNKLHGEAVSAQTQVDDLAREQQRIDRDVQQVRARKDRDQQRMLAGGLPAKELSGLEHELQTLARRQGELEDIELEVMQQVEDAEKSLVAVREQETELRARSDTLTAGRDAAYAEIDAVIADRTAERVRTAGEIPADLVALYQKIRDGSGGVGAAALKQRRCEGCRLELAPTEMVTIRRAPADEVLRCEECRRILVRL